MYDLFLRVQISDPMFKIPEWNVAAKQWPYNWRKCIVEQVTVMIPQSINVENLTTSLVLHLSRSYKHINHTIFAGQDTS